jgi:Domain of unknown function (DUF222)
VSTVPVFASPTEAMRMVRAGLDYLVATDATAIAAEEQAWCLRGFEQVNSVVTAARTSFLGAFTAGQGYAADADYSPRAWLMHKLGITKGAAVAYTAWLRRTEAHPVVAGRLAAGEISESVARTLCLWTGALPEERREDADKILTDAAVSGLGLADLAGLFAEIYQRSRDGEPDEDKDESFEDRALRLVTTLDGAGVLHGDLTPECAAAVQSVVDALAAPAGAEDTRTREQRCHDALLEAMRRLAAAGMLPERAGQPVKVWALVPLAELLQMDGSTALVRQWVAQMRAAWAAHRAEAAEGGGHIGAWLDGDAARAVACDAAMAPVVTGEVNPAALDDLVRLCVQLDKLRHGCPDSDGADGTGDTAGAEAPADTSPAREAVEQAIIGTAVDLLSGPGGLASFLRRRQLGARLGGPSLPLDIGYAETIPAGIRNAVILRDRHCRWAGGCNQPASACEVHHVTHKANGGKTSTTMCVLLCFFHHQVVIHRWGWTLVLNPDGTTTAWNKDRTKILHSHGPPARPG